MKQLTPVSVSLYFQCFKLNLNAPIATTVVCFSRLLKCLRSLYEISVDPEQTAPTVAVCSGTTLFVSILNSSVMLGNDLQQTTSADDILRCIFFLALKGKFEVDMFFMCYSQMQTLCDAFSCQSHLYFYFVVWHFYS